MKQIIILCVMSSLLNDFIVRNVPALSNLTSLLTIIFMFLAGTYLVKGQKVKNINIYI
ncbi:hypothetical protein [[Clostridium] dakarense]|uniref:hypothetical protein n=1 Tax=Faecalimicrobium dakarense TaxID=1301100 RepID=UPI0004AC80BD|nr:hypothetical protein [[Clostridium] dakarense]